MDENQVRQIIREELLKLTTAERWVFQQHLQMFDGKNIQVAKGTGTQIGTEATQKIGLYGVVPVVQAGAITDASGGAVQDAEVRNVVTDILAALHNIGIIA